MTNEELKIKVNELLPAATFEEGAEWLTALIKPEEWRLLAQQLRPESFVMVMGYGECAPGFVATDRAWEENDDNLRDWCWVGPSEQAMTKAIQTALKRRT